MNAKEGRDVARQAANVLGALFQIGAPVLTGEAVGRISAENGTLVVPADYAFSIWGLIFLLCLAYAATVLWALVAVVVNQYDASILTTIAASIAAVPVALVVAGKLLGRPGRKIKRTLSRHAPA